MNDKITITPDMNLGIQSPGEDVMEENVSEKSVSKAQQRFFGMVHAYQKGDLDSDEVGKSVKKAAKSMTKKDVKDFAKTKHKGLPEHVNEHCNGKNPYCGEKKNMETAEKDMVENNPINFNKKQKAIKINESQLRKMVREAIMNELSIDTIDNARKVATQKAMAADYGTPERVRRDAQAKNFKKTRDERLGFEPEKMNQTMRQAGTSGDETIDRRWARYTKDAEDRRIGNRLYNKETGRWQTLSESVQNAVIKAMGKYTKGEISSKEANKAIMDLANASNGKKINESQLRKMVREAIMNELSIDTEYNFLNKTKEMGRDFQHYAGLNNIIEKYNSQFAFESMFPDGARLQVSLNHDLGLTLRLVERDVEDVWYAKYDKNSQRIIYYNSNNSDVEDFKHTPFGFYIDNLKAGQREKYIQLIRVMKHLNGFTPQG